MIFIFTTLKGISIMTLNKKLLMAFFASFVFTNMLSAMEEQESDVKYSLGKVREELVGFTNQEMCKAAEMGKTKITQASNFLLENVATPAAKITCSVGETINKYTYGSLICADKITTGSFKFFECLPLVTKLGNAYKYSRDGLLELGKQKNE